MCKAGVVPRLKPWATLAAVAWLLGCNEISVVLTSEGRWPGEEEQEVLNHSFLKVGYSQGVFAESLAGPSSQEPVIRHTCDWQFL